MSFFLLKYSSTASTGLAKCDSLKGFETTVLAVALISLSKVLYD